MLFLKETQVETIIPMPQAIEAVEEAPGGDLSRQRRGAAAPAHPSHQPDAVRRAAGLLQGGHGSLPAN